MIDRETRNTKVIVTDVLRTIAITLVFPTLVFSIANAFLFLQRPLVNVDYWLLFLLAFPFSRWLTILGFSILLCLDVVFSLAPAYHFSVGSVLSSLADIFSLKPLYLITEATKVVGLLAGAALFAAYVMRRLKSARTAALTSILLLGSAIALDQAFSLGTIRRDILPHDNPNIAGSSLNDIRIAVSTGTRRSETVSQPEIATSAAMTSGLWTIDSRDAPNVIIVMVESLGEPNDTSVSSFQWSAIERLEELPNIRVERGTVPFVGSTVAAEFRELCNSRLLAVHPDPDMVSDLDCLVERYGAKGYSTVAVHGFSGTLFGRNRWYTELGFETVLFGPDLWDKYELKDRCGLAFSGVCDHQVWDVIQDDLISGSAAPSFLYWLTLTTHLPVEPPTTKDLERCNAVSGVADSAAACSLVLHHQRLLSHIANSVRKGVLSNTKILLVGDHAPPYVKLNDRSLFSSDSVPFALLHIE